MCWGIRFCSIACPVSHVQLADKHSSNDESHICGPHQWWKGIGECRASKRKSENEKGFNTIKKWMEKSKTFFLSNMLSFLFVFVIYRAAAHWLNYVWVSSFFSFSLSLLLWPQQMHREWERGQNKHHTHTRVCMCVSNLVFSHLGYLLKDCLCLCLIFFCRLIISSRLVCASVCIDINVALQFRLRWNSNPIHTLSPMMLHLFCCTHTFFADFGPTKQPKKKTQAIQWSLTQKCTTN